MDSSPAPQACRLTDKDCIPCQKGVPPLQGESLSALYEQLPAGWEVRQGHHLYKAFAFRNFKKALEYTNRLGDLAEGQGHHPDIYLAWGKVALKIWTHKIDGLSESDFVMAAKADALAQAYTAPPK